MFTVSSRNLLANMGNEFPYILIISIWLQIKDCRVIFCQANHPNVYSCSNLIRFLLVLWITSKYFVKVCICEDREIEIFYDCSKHVIHIRTASNYLACLSNRPYCALYRQMHLLCMLNQWELSYKLSNNHPLQVSYQIKKDISFLMKNEKYQAINKLDG